PTKHINAYTTLDQVRVAHHQEHRNEQRPDPVRADHHGPHGQPALHRGRDQRAEHPARRRHAEHHADRGGRTVPAAGHHDHRQEQRLEQQIAPGDQEGGRPQERLPPQPAHPLGEIPVQRGGARAPPGLELAADQQQPDQRPQVAGGIEEERHRPAQAEEHAAQRLAQHRGAARPRLVAGERGGELGGVHHVGDGRRGGDPEAHRQRALGEPDREHVRQREPVQQQGRRHAADGRTAQHIAGDHRPPPVPAVDQRSGRQLEQQLRQQGDEAGEPGVGRGAGQREDQQRVGHAGGVGAQARDRRRLPQQDEVSVAQQRLDITGDFLAHGGGHGSMLGGRPPSSQRRTGSHARSPRPEVRRADPAAGRRAVGRLLPGRWSVTGPDPVARTGRPRMSTSPSSRAELLQRRLRGVTKKRQDGIVPVPRDGALPLSFAQHRMWVLDRLRPGGTEYLMPLLLRLPGPLDPAALRRALDALVARHEVLRTRYPAVDDEPVLVIDEPGPIALTTVDLRGADGDEDGSEADGGGGAALARAERRLAELVAEDGRRPFDLAAEHPVRALLARLDEDVHAVLLTLHHIASDGWSEGVLLGELDRLYQAFAAGRPAPLEPAGPQYADFAAWQREHLTGDRLAAQLAYWRTTLAGLTPLALPTDRPRGPVRDAAGATATFTVPAELVQPLVALGRSQGATPFMVFLAAFQLLLGRSCGQHDVVVGTPVAGRDRPETQAMVGLFANTVALRTDLSGAPSFLELLGRVRETALGAFTHQETPFERLVDELAPERDPSRNPIFQVVFQLAAHTPPEPGALRAEQRPVDWRTAKFDLGLALGSTAEGAIAGQLEYATALFDEATIHRTIAHYLRLLAAIAADPGKPVHRLELLPDAERALLASWSGSGRDHAAEQTLPEVFERWAARTPDAPAVRCEGVSLGYGELNARANRLAHRLRALGAGPETLVGVRFERGLDLVVALLGVLKSGAGYLPLDPGQPADRLAYILADAGVTALVADRRTGEETVTTLLLDEDDRQWPATDPAPLAGPGNTAYVIYTSGSTGTPKGVQVTHANVLRLLDSCRQDFGFGPEDVWTLFHSYAFDFSVWELWGALLNGGRVVVVPYAVSRSPQDFLDLLVAERVTVLNQTPSAFRGLQEAVALADLRPDALALRTVVFGGEALDVTELAPWFERFGDRRPSLVNMYGITETTVHVTHRPVRAGEEAGARRSPIGRPLGDLRLYLLDPDLDRVPIGVPGQLYVSGPGLARGYLGRPGLTAERFLPDPFAAEPGARMYRTGDLARYGADGDLEFLGRADEQVKIRGHRIEPGEIEAALAGLPEVDGSLVIAHRRPGEREARLIAYVVARAGRSVEAAELRARLGRTLPGYMVPAVFVPLDAFPMTANGKIDRRALPDPDAHGVRGAGEYVNPRTRSEQIVAETWAEVLGLPKVGALDNFFELGGDSIRAIKVVGALRRRGIDLTVQNLLVHQSVEGLAGFAGTAASGGPASVEEERVAPFALLTPADRAALPPGLVDAYPLAMVQAAMVYQMLADRDESPYHNITLFPFIDDAPFSLPALRAAAAQLTRRHEILRTGFDLTAFSEPLQLVHAHAEVQVGYDDLRGLDEEQVRAELERFAAETRRTPFDVGEAPMLRFHVHQTAEDRWTFSFVECHAILDGWSHHSLIDELMADYRAIRAGLAPAGPAGHTVRFRRPRRAGAALARLRGGPGVLAGARRRLRAGRPAVRLGRRSTGRRAAVPDHRAVPGPGAGPAPAGRHRRGAAQERAVRRPSQGAVHDQRQPPLPQRPGLQRPPGDRRRRAGPRHAPQHPPARRRADRRHLERTGRAGLHRRGGGLAAPPVPAAGDAARLGRGHSPRRRRLHLPGLPRPGQPADRLRQGGRRQPQRVRAGRVDLPRRPVRLRPARADQPRRRAPAGRAVPADPGGDGRRPAGRRPGQLPGRRGTRPAGGVRDRPRHGLPGRLPAPAVRGAGRAHPAGHGTALRRRQHPRLRGTQRPRQPAGQATGRTRGRPGGPGRRAAAPRPGAGGRAAGGPQGGRRLPAARPGPPRGPADGADRRDRRPGGRHRDRPGRPARRERRRTPAGRPGPRHRRPGPGRPRPAGDTGFAGLRDLHLRLDRNAQGRDDRAPQPGQLRVLVPGRLPAPGRHRSPAVLLDGLRPPGHLPLPRAALRPAGHPDRGRRHAGDRRPGRGAGARSVRTAEADALPPGAAEPGAVPAGAAARGRTPDRRRRGADPGDGLALGRTRADTVVDNEYGPTETTVGCSYLEGTPGELPAGVLPIGRPFANTTMRVL
ncbi:pyoverdine sidechain peptide synthetase III, L-Thr-L-Ser component, partial [Streptomyces sp. e14]